nr:deoxyhypusine synthase isoform X2 [Tanacetum cinerariifolium]
MQDVDFKLLSKQEYWHDLILAFRLEDGTEHIGEVLQHVKKEHILRAYKIQEWYIQSTCATSREGLYEGLDWLPNNISNKNDILVLYPGLTNGSLGDMLLLHSFRNTGLVVDVVQDLRAINGEAMHASRRKTRMIILGGGLPKHYICNVNLMREWPDMLFG